MREYDEQERTVFVGRDKTFDVEIDIKKQEEAEIHGEVVCVCMREVGRCGCRCEWKALTLAYLF